MAKAKKDAKTKKPQITKAGRRQAVKKSVPKTVAKPVRSRKTVAKASAKKRVIKSTTKFSQVKKGKDTGSVEVQIDNFTFKIKSLLKHLKKHNGDNDSRRGLLVMVGKRRRLLNYIKKNDFKRYAKIVNKLKLKE